MFSDSTSGRTSRGSGSRPLAQPLLRAPLRALQPHQTQAPSPPPPPPPPPNQCCVQQSNRASRPVLLSTATLLPSFILARRKRVTRSFHVIGFVPFCRYAGFHLPRSLTHDFLGSASWDLADGLARLNMNGGFDTTENIRGPIRTPPKTKKATETVVQLHDSSPLESSDTSLDSGPSPPASDERLALVNHSRVYSADTTASSQLSGSSHTLASSALGLKVGTEQRPHSYSGGLSAADIQRLRGVGASPPDGERAQWSAAVDRQTQHDQPLYPSLSSYPHRFIVPYALHRRRLLSFVTFAALYLLQRLKARLNPRC